MKTQFISARLLERLDASVGQHCRIAKEAGISQATISRWYLRKCSPSLEKAEALMAWYDADEERKDREAMERLAQRLPNTERVRFRRPATEPVAVAQ